MNATFKAQIRERLLSERAALVAQLSDLRGGALSRVEGAQGLALQPGDSPAQNATERDLHYAIDDHDSREIVLIDAALARLDIGDYGQCISCGIEIPVARLTAQPSAERCINCQEDYEKTHGSA